MYSDEKILIVDDDTIFLKFITSTLSDKFNILTADSGIDGLKLLESEGPFALVMVDFLMPEMNGVEFLEKVYGKFPDTVRMILTGVTDLQPIMNIINYINIFRFINKPCSAATLCKIFESGIEQYRLVQSEKVKRNEAEAAYKQLIQYAKALNETVTTLKNKNRELNNAYYDTINRLAVASEYKDEDTHEHIVRMSRYSALLARKLGFTAEGIDNILFASPMHDVGKIGIPDVIIMKPGKLTLIEYDQIKNHTIIGAKILEGSNAEILDLARIIAISHHEKWNGKGYPYGISGDNIPLAGRIVALADTFDALISKRPYKDAYPVEIVYDIIKRERGEQFDPAIVDIFIDNYDEFIQIKNNVSVFEQKTCGNFILSERDIDEHIS